MSARTALITGGSRGIGAETALSLARRGCDVAITYRNKAARAAEVARAVEECGTGCLVVQCDITDGDSLRSLSRQVHAWAKSLDILVLNASGGLERDRLAADPDYPWRINCGAQVAALETFLPLMTSGATVVYVTSHWAHLYGRVTQLPAYEPIAQSKRAGEDAIRARQDELSDRGIRLVVVTGDMIEGTITPKLLERAGPGMLDERRVATGGLPSAAEMGEQIAMAALDDDVPSGSTVVVGGSLDALV